MFTITLLASAITALGAQTPVQPLSCPVTLEPIVAGMKVTTWSGVRFTYCCPGCDTQFTKDPQAALDKAIKAGKTIGVFLFDPMSKKPLDAEKAKGGFSDYHGVRYYFENKDEKKSFDLTPAKYGELPKKEALYCPVSKETVESYAKASGYGDFEGVRYYFCCPDCDKPFAADPSKYAPMAKAFVKSPVATTVQPKGETK